MQKQHCRFGEVNLGLDLKILHQNNNCRFGEVNFIDKTLH
jgi:hypothetical protein